MHTSVQSPSPSRVFLAAEELARLKAQSSQQLFEMESRIADTLAAQQVGLRRDWASFAVFGAASFLLWCP